MNARRAFLALAMMVCLGIAPLTSIARQGEDTLKPGTTAPDFTLKDISGKSVSLQKLAKGKKGVLVNFWQYH